MKILIFTPQIYLLSGAERLAVELAEDINSRPGIRADVLSMVPETFPGTEVVKNRLLEHGVQSVQFLGRPPGIGGRNLIPTIWKLRQILIKGDYDVIETTLHGPNTLACWATLGLKTKHIAGIHAIYQLPQHNSIALKFWRWSVQMNYSTYFYGVSQEVVQQWIRYAKIKPARVRCIYNAINSSCFQTKPDRITISRELGIDPNHHWLLFVGRLTHQKGLDILIEAIKPLLKSEKVSLLLIGLPGDVPDISYGETKGYLEQLKQKLASEVPSNTVKWLGRREDVPRIMASADVLVHPARHEGFGLVLAEALAVGLPVVATNVGGIPEVLNGTDSIMVSPDNPTELRTAICQVLNRTSTEANLACKHGLDRSEFFRLQRRTNELLKYFTDVIDNKT